MNYAQRKAVLAAIDNCEDNLSRYKVELLSLNGNEWTATLSAIQKLEKRIAELKEGL